MRFERNPNAGVGGVEVLSGRACAEARAEIRSWPGYAPTPLRELTGLGPGRVWYKDEGSRFGLGSFKALGGAYAVLRMIQAEIPASSADLRAGAHAGRTGGMTFATATDGNHGRAVAWGARMFGANSVIFLPAACSANREAAIAAYGATMVRTGMDYDDTVRECARIAGERGWCVVSDTSWDGYTAAPRNVMEGYTLLADETVSQLPEGVRLTHVLVQAGVGGLAAAVCAYMSDRFGARRPKFVVVEPEGARCLMASAIAGRPVKAPGPIRTIMAGLDCGEASPLAWEILRSGADAFLSVPDEVTGPVMRLLAEREIQAGESAIAGLAGYMGAWEKLGVGPESEVLVLGTEGPTDPALYRELVYGS